MQFSGYQSVQHRQAMRPPSQHPAPPQLSIPGHPQHPYTQYTISPSPATGGQMVHPQMIPQSPSEDSERVATVEEDFSQLSGPPPTSHVWNGFVWGLQVVQHPHRARMCGFGDKDRRPISPPPCIRLIVLDAITRKEVDYNEIDLSHLVLNVDIWDVTGVKEMNLVKQSNASPCISSAATGAYPTSTAGPPPTHSIPEVFSGDAAQYSQHRNLSISNNSGNNYQAPPAAPIHPVRQTYTSGQNGFVPPPPPPGYQNGLSSYPGTPYQQYPDNRYASQAAPPPPLSRQMYTNQLPSIATMTNAISQQPTATHQGIEPPYAHTQPSNSQMYTRNLIGSLCASAFRLKDETDTVGIWFVLQDLSVRTEGWFRLKATFFNLADAVPKQQAEAAAGSSSGSKDLTAPCLASTYTTPFRVYSAKKFPGVVESTPLSKAFANQGIKIPIRKDTGSKRIREGSDDEGSGGED